MLCLQQSVLWLGTHPYRPEFYSTHQRLRTVPGICCSKITLGYFLKKSQTSQRHSKDPAKTLAQRKITLSFVLFISLTAALEAAATEILDAFTSVSCSSHLFSRSNCFLLLWAKNSWWGLSLLFVSHN